MIQNAVGLNQLRFLCDLTAQFPYVKLVKNKVI